MDKKMESRLYYQEHRLEILRKCKEKYDKFGPRPYELCKKSLGKYRKSFKGRYKAWVGRCKRSNIIHSVLYNEWLEYITGACHYCCGTLPSQGCGLDRKNPNIGYVQGNLVACCKRCNTMKNNFLTYEEMRTVGRSLYEYWLKQGNHLKETHDEDTAKGSTSTAKLSESDINSIIRSAS